MLRSITSLPLSDTTISQLRDNGFYYVEDIANESDTELPTTCSHAIQEAQILCKVPVSVSALTVLKEELQQYKISTLSKELNNMLDGGFQCKTITELCGAPGSAKTQICLQICITVQLMRRHGGLRGEVLYIDTRSGVSTMRLKEMAASCQTYFGVEDFDINSILDRIIVTSPQTFDEVFAILNTINHSTNNCQIRLVIVDSLTFLRYTVEDTLHRTQICFKILDELHKLATRHNLAVVVTNELVTQVMDKGGVDLAPAGGILCAHRVHKRLMLTRLDDNQFAACAVKAITMPKVSSKFQVTADGIRDITD